MSTPDGIATPVTVWKRKRSRLRATLSFTAFVARNGDGSRMTGVERMRLTRRRRKHGEAVIKLIVTSQQMDLLVARGYELDRRDPASIASACS